MATYAIGDVQGCHDELQRLLKRVGFDRRQDRLWFTGDLVNRGPESVAVLRFVHALGERATVVLGNHDLHLLACRYVADHRPRPRDTLHDVLAAPDCDRLLDWLRRRPFLHSEPATPYVLVHAGIYPAWTPAEARARAGEIERALAGADFPELLAAMYGNTPERWDAALAGAERARFIVNAFTRMRYVTPDGRLDLQQKTALANPDSRLVPWFAHGGRQAGGDRVIFGHWSTLKLDDASRRRFGVEPLDTGAVWGGALTALRLDDGKKFSVKSRFAAIGSD